MNVKEYIHLKNRQKTTTGGRISLTIAGVGVAQGFLCVETHADVATVGRRRAGAGARPLVVTAAAAHRALRPRRPAGPGAFHCDAKHQTEFGLNLHIMF